jgi:hypothetical protein
MAHSGSPLSTQAGSASGSSRRDSNRWTTVKQGLVLGLKATEMALDGLPIPGAKGCISLILHLIETADVGCTYLPGLSWLKRN